MLINLCLVGIHSSQRASTASNRNSLTVSVAATGEKLNPLNNVVYVMDTIKTIQYYFYE